MNIAFPAFFILTLLLPGFIFQNAYEKVERTNIEKKPFDVSSSLAFFYALLIHATLCFIIVPITGNVIDYELCVQLLTGSKSIPVSEMTGISENIPKIFSYFSTSFLIAHILGRIAQSLIFKFNPYKSSLLAFDTPWYYELTGKLSETKDAQLIKLSCLVETKNTSFLYYGVLEDFYLNDDGKLDRVVLSDTMRRPIENDQKSSEDEQNKRFYEIKGDRIILKYDDIKNVNIEYLYMAEEP